MSPELFTKVFFQETFIKKSTFTVSKKKIALLYSVVHFVLIITEICNILFLGERRGFLFFLFKCAVILVPFFLFGFPKQNFLMFFSSCSGGVARGCPANREL